MRQAGRREASCLPTFRYTTNGKGERQTLAHKKAKRVTAGETALFWTLPVVASGDGDREKAVGFRLATDCKSGLSARTTPGLQAIPLHCAMQGALSPGGIYLAQTRIIKPAPARLLLCGTSLETADWMRVESLFLPPDLPGTQPEHASRWKIILVDRMQYFRFPRSKKRRIRAKWRQRPENYRPLMVPVGHFFAMGALAGPVCYGDRILLEPKPHHFAPYFNEADPARPRIMEMHTRLWEKISAEYPEFATRCDLFKRVERTGTCVIWSDDVRCSKEDYTLTEPLPPVPAWIKEVVK